MAASSYNGLQENKLFNVDLLDVVYVPFVVTNDSMVNIAVKILLSSKLVDVDGKNL